MNSKNNNNKKIFLLKLLKTSDWQYWLLLWGFFIRTHKRIASVWKSSLCQLSHRCHNCPRRETKAVTFVCLSWEECMNTLKTGCPASESDSTPPAYLQLHSRHSSHSQVCPEALSHAVWSFRDRRSFKFNLFCSDAWSTPKILQQSCIESSPETVAGRTEVNSQGVRARLAKQERCRI